LPAEELNDFAGLGCELFEVVLDRSELGPQLARDLLAPARDGEDGSADGSVVTGAPSFPRVQAN